MSADDLSSRIEEAREGHQKATDLFENARQTLKLEAAFFSGAGERGEFVARISESSSKEFNDLVEAGSITQDNLRQTRYFYTEAVPGDGLIVAEFVIQEEISGGFLRGDGRGLTNDPLDENLSLDDSRVFIVLDRETGRGAVTVSGSEAQLPWPLNGGVEWGARPISFEERELDEVIPNNYFNIDASEDLIRIDYDSINSITAPIQVISVDGPIVLERDANGEFKVSSENSPDLYPAISVTQYRPNEGLTNLYFEEGTNVLEGATELGQAIRETANETVEAAQEVSQANSWEEKLYETVEGNIEVNREIAEGVVEVNREIADEAFEFGRAVKREIGVV